MRAPRRRRRSERAQELALVNARRNAHRFQRLGSRQKYVRRIAKDRSALRLSDVAVPQRGPTPEQPAELIDARLKVVEQRAEWTDVEHAQPRPALFKHPREKGEQSGLGLAPGGRCAQQHMLASEYRFDGAFLERSEGTPAE